MVLELTRAAVSAVVAAASLDLCLGGIQFQVLLIVGLSSCKPSVVDDGDEDDDDADEDDDVFLALLLSFLLLFSDARSSIVSSCTGAIVTALAFEAPLVMGGSGVVLAIDSGGFFVRTPLVAAVIEDGYFTACRRSSLNITPPLLLLLLLLLLPRVHHRLRWVPEIVLFQYLLQFRMPCCF